MSDSNDSSGNAQQEFLPLQQEGQSEAKTAEHTEVSDPNKNTIQEDTDFIQGNQKSGDNDGSDQQQQSYGGGDDSTQQQSSSAGDDTTQQYSSGSGDDTTQQQSYGGDDTTQQRSSGGDDTTQQRSSGGDDDTTQQQSSSSGAGDDSGNTEGDSSGQQDDSGEGGDGEKKKTSKRENVDSIPTAGGERLGEKHWGESKVVPDVPDQQAQGDGQGVSSSEGQPDQETADNTARNAGGSSADDTTDGGDGSGSLIDKIKAKLPIGGSKSDN